MDQKSLDAWLDYKIQEAIKNKSTLDTDALEQYAECYARLRGSRMPMQEDVDRTISKQEHVFPAAPHGSEMLIMVRLQGGTASEHNYVVHLPPTSTTTHAEVILRMVGYPPPPPPESTQDRRKRLITEVLNRARKAGKLGLTTDDQTNTVNALMAALSDEFVENCELDHYEEMGGGH